MPPMESRKPQGPLRETLREGDGIPQASGSPSGDPAGGDSYSGQRADHGWRMTLSVWGGSGMDYQCFMDRQAHADFIAHQTVNTSLCN